MKIYNIWPVLENPLYLGLYLEGDASDLCTFPTNWHKNPRNWEVKLLKPNWHSRQAGGDGLACNDYPCINLSYPAFSQRAVDLIGNILEANGELLPVRHKLGTYYLYNCTTLVNIIDFSNLKNDELFKINLDSASIKSDRVSELIIFKDRVLPTEQLCTQTFVNIVNAAGLEGFLFLPVWPLLEGESYSSVKRHLYEDSKKWKPKLLESIDLRSNAVLLRLICNKKKVTKKEIADSEIVMDFLENAIQDSINSQSTFYLGQIEGSDVVDHEIRVFFSTPDCDLLIATLGLSLKSLPWPNKYYVVKRRGDYTDGQAMEEYVKII